MKIEAIFVSALLVLFLFSVFPTRMCAGQGASITLHPTQGYAWSTVQFTLSGFTSPAGYDIRFDTTGLAGGPGPSVGQGELDASGGAVGSLWVRGTASGTPVTVTVSAQDVGVDPTVFAYTSFTILPPTITLYPTSGPVGTTVSVTGHGFLSGGARIEGNPVYPPTVYLTADSNGDISGSFNVSSYPDPGVCTVYAVDLGSGSYGTAPFTVTGGTPTPTPRMTPTITLNPTKGPPGMNVSFTGTGFTPGGSVIISYATILLATVTADSTGDISGSFMVPSAWSPDKYTVEALDTATKTEGTELFTATALTPTIAVNPPRGPAGSTVYFTLSGFLPNDPNCVVWIDSPHQSVKAGEAPGNIGLDGSGEGSFTVPPDEPRTYVVEAADAYGNAATTWFTIIAIEALTATVSGNSATVNESATTGVSVTVSGASLLNGAQVTVTSIAYGDSQPSGTGNVSLSGAVFYDVSVTSSNGALGSDVNANVSISNPSFNSSSVTEYNNGAAWVSVATKFSAPETLSATIPASALNGTPIAVGIPSHGGSANPLAITFGSTAFILMVVAVVAVTISAVALVARKLTRTRSVSKSDNQVEKQGTGDG
jgi:hypothetical protein